MNKKYKTMKIIKKLGLLILFISVSISAQEKKTLSLNDATLGYYKGLYPKNIYNLKWVDNSNVYMQRKNNNFVFTDAKNNEVVRTITLADFQKAYPKLQRLPFYIKNVNASEITFKNGSVYNTFNYLEGKNNATISMPKKVGNAEYNNKANAVAYTIDNNLFVATVDNPKIVITDIIIVVNLVLPKELFGVQKGIF